MSHEKALSLNEIRSRIAQFALDYKDTTKEKQDAQNFWRDLMYCYGITSVKRRGVLFEHEAVRSDTGNVGYIDVFLPGHFLIEHKSAGKITVSAGTGKSNAEEQAEAYLTGGSIKDKALPKYVLTSDFRSIQVTDLDKPKSDPTRTVTVLTRDLPEHIETFLFLTGDEDVDAFVREDQAEASIQAARLMGHLFSALTKDSDSLNEESARDEDDETYDASILLTRLLFLMFGDDAGLWSRSQFQRFVIERTVEDGSDLGSQLTTLFDVLDTPEGDRDPRMDEAFSSFPYVNGALFNRDVRTSTWFDREMRDALLEACAFDWSRISPAVFGSLFQTVHSKEARHAGGEHYTSEENILKTLRPLFLDGLRQKLDSANTKPTLEKLHAELLEYRYVDPACGCGNFLIVAYRELRQLELDLLVKLRAKQGLADKLVLDASELLNVSLDQFTGIEIKWWPAKIAETAMFLVDHQANRRMEKALGTTPRRLPINVQSNIIHGNAHAIDWLTELPSEGHTVFMFGNPPFLGHADRTERQKTELQEAWGTASIGHLDYVTAWHARALSYFSLVPGEFAFVSSNSITQGKQPPGLFGPVEEEGWRIKFAHRTFSWDSETAFRDKAAVHCVIVGFTRDQEIPQRLFDYDTPTSEPVEVNLEVGINAYLADAPSVFVTSCRSPLNPDLPKVSFGSMPNDGGGLLVSEGEFEEMSEDPVAKKYLRPFVGADELISGDRRWCLWMEDLDPKDLKLSPALDSRVSSVRSTRLASRRATTRALADTPYLFGEIRQPAVPYLCIPRHFAENRRFATAARLQPKVIAGDATFTCPDPDGFAFAIISSTMYITWQKSIGGRIKSDPRFSGTLTWNSFPLPQIEPDLRAKIIASGEDVLQARALTPNRSLEELYAPLGMSRDLLAAHKILDKEIDRAFGIVRGQPSLLKRQTVLFDSYKQLTSN
ncbi:MAG: class I SAM-dependent DNA methyltransferase [Solirubrobacterales bacterium]|nr:class I SAM-dependent DNA methyltransferase [Solirubrobacterales bacterium]